ncbi:MAG: HAD family acid phosphatase [Pirellulales bacterium]
MYQQLSAEYRALCLQTYAAAAKRLEYLLAVNHPTKPAVILDLDETVFDNSAFQTFLHRENSEYTDDLWLTYEKSHGAGRAPRSRREKIPGAMRRAGATPVFLSNRSDANRAETIAALKRLGIDTANIENRLFLKPVYGSSEKATRREAVAARYNVVLMIGDNLRDFSESFTAAKLPKEPSVDDVRAEIARRNTLADGAECHWGVDWFVLPNSVYGEWDRLVGPNPQALFRPTTIPSPKTP